MDKTNLNIYQKFLLIFIAVVTVIAGYFAINARTSSLLHEKYLETSKEMQDEFATLVTEKKDAMLLLGYTLAQDKTIHQALLENRYKDIDMENFVNTLITNTGIWHIQFHIVDADAKSFYRSWTKKRGDDLRSVRLDVVKMLEDQEASSVISVGMYDITFKALVPIFYKEKFIGSIESISKTTSIVNKMKEKTYETIIVVDKRYKKQLSYPFTNHFIDDYYIATPNPSAAHLEFINKLSLQKVLQTSEYIYDEKNNFISTSYPLYDVNGDIMAYALIFNPSSNIKLDAIIRDRNFITLLFGMIFFIIASVFYYLYIRRHSRFIQKMNQRLEESVEEKTKTLRYLAHHDILTGLPNRLLLIDRLEQAILHAKSHRGNVYLLFLDLDRFKEVNDSFGHESGDKLLVAISKRLLACVREEDTVARLGGDEFTILISGLELKELISVLNAILVSMKEPIEINTIPTYSTFSIGVSRYPNDGDTPDILIRNADTAMYKAKETGKNRYQFYDEQMTAKMMQRVTLENNLRLAIEHNQLEPYFQAQVDANTNKVIGVEALVRWNHPDLGIIPPTQFIPLAEEIGLIALIDEWMMQRCFTLIKKLQNKNLFDGQLSLNLSVKQLENSSFIKKLQNYLKESGFEATKLELEITESQIMQNPEDAISALNKIKEMGISIAIDDFGTGYSSLSYLKKLPIHKLKIDRSFIKDLPEDAEDVAITQTIIALAKSLKVDVLAEGVETPEQKEFLLQEGCFKIQGYLYSKPLCYKEFEKFLQGYKEV
jgi:diguanylate cyclase (GGDEF)-like protein